MKLCDIDEDNSLLSMTPSQDGIPPPDPLRVDWPKVNSSSVYEISSPQLYTSVNKPLFVLLVNDWGLPL